MEDVEILLALINEVDDHRTYPPESPRNAHHLDPSNVRTRQIFDSLAEILVHNVAGEVVAVGIQRNEERIIITFSTNQSQEPQYIHDHLNTIWGFLKQASEVYRRHQSPANTPKSSPRSPRSRSPRVITTEKLPGDEQDKIYNLLLAIYRYSSRKYLSRVQKRRDVTKPTRFEIFQRIVNSIDPLNGELGALLNEVSTNVDLIIQDLSSAHVLTSATQDFKDFCGCFEHLAFIVEKLEEHPQELKRIADTNGMLFNYT